MKTSIKLLFFFLFFACNKTGTIEPPVPPVPPKPPIELYPGLYININDKRDTINVSFFTKDSLIFKYFDRLSFTVRIYDTSTFFSYDVPKNYKNKVAEEIRYRYYNPDRYEDAYILYDFVKRNFIINKDTLNFLTDVGKSIIEIKKDGSTFNRRDPYTLNTGKFIKVK